MPWPMFWPEFLKKRLCRYLLQHYIGHFFKEKISLEQLSIDIYNGTGCVKNLNLDCDSLNEQLNAASSSSSGGGTSSGGVSSIPIEIVSGFVGYISVYIPWHDLLNDYCKLTIKNVQITIRVKQKKPVLKSSFGGPHTTRRSFESELDDEDGNDGELDSSNSSSMFSSMFIDSIMNTSMHIAQECLNSDEFGGGGGGGGGLGGFGGDHIESPEKSNTKSSANNSGSSNLLGLEAFASTIDSILSRIKITLEQIQIRVENLDGSVMGAGASFSDMTNAGCDGLGGNGGGSHQPFMSSSTIFNQKPSNGVALELRIKSIKYFDLDSVNASGSGSTNNTPGNSLDHQSSVGQTNPVRNTTKSFNIEGLTVYFDEFVVRDDYNSNDLDNGGPTTRTSAASRGSNTTSTHETTMNSSSETSLNSTIDLKDSSSSSSSTNTNGSSSTSMLDTSATTAAAAATATPVDESAPFNFELNPDYYLYTNPVIMLTFSGTQSIKLTVNNMKPTDLMTTGDDAADSALGIKDQQRPFLEVNAQFGAIKSLLCPKQIHLLTDMATKLTDYVEAANAYKKALKIALQRQRYLRRTGKTKGKLGALNKQIRGFDNRKRFESLLLNDELTTAGGFGSEAVGGGGGGGPASLNDEIDLNDDGNQQFKSILIGGGGGQQQQRTSSMSSGVVDESAMFYSMMSESTMINNNNNNQHHHHHHHHHSHVDLNETIDSTNDGEKYFDDDDRNQVKFAKNMKQTIELLQNDVILANKTKSSSSSSSSTHHNLFQTFRVSVRMFSLTVLHYDPIYSNASATAAAAAAASRSSSSTINNNRSNSNTRRFIVERIKPICDSYFDFVSTIDTSNVTTTASAHSHTQTIDKSIVAKYHQACALNDHFLVLLKPVTFNLVQKINQRQLNNNNNNNEGASDLSNGYGASPSSDPANSIHYSLNDMTLTVGYMQLNEYLLAENSLDKWEATLRSSSSSSSSARKSKQQAQILEISQAASVVELVTFQDLSGSGTNTTTSGIDQPCLKIQLTFYDPLDVIAPSTRTRSFSRRGSSSSSSRNFVDLNRMLSRSFENVSLQLNHCLSFELDISLVDRLYYILNDVSKPTFGAAGSSSSSTAAPSNTASGFPGPNRSVQNKNKTTTKVRNIEIKCVQQVKMLLRFPIADLRRSGSTNISTATFGPTTATATTTTTTTTTTQDTKHTPVNPSVSSTTTTATTSVPPAASSSSTSTASNSSGSGSRPTPVNHIKPQTMIAFRRLREQCLTLHVFDLSFQTIQQPSIGLPQQQQQQQATAGVLDLLTFTIVCSQINTYYQYSRRERPIHFGLVQAKLGEPRSLYCSIKLPMSDVDAADNDYDECFGQMLGEDGKQRASASGSLAATEMDSLKATYNIDFGRPNRFATGGKTVTIKEENELTGGHGDNYNNDNDRATDSEEDDNNGNNDDDEDEDEGLGESGGRMYGPFSRIHTLISSEKNRRIVNAGNKTEMNAFVAESRANSQMCIRLHVPQIKCLLSDQRFLNDIYNCFLNDLIMWLPTRLPPIESSLLVWDAAAGSYVAPNLATLIESGNLEFFEFLAAINPSVNMAGILGFGSPLDPNNDNNDNDDEDNLSDGEGRMFHMCKSAILKSPSAASDLSAGGGGGSGVIIGGGDENLLGRNSSTTGVGSAGSGGGNGGNDYCESDDDRSKRKYMDRASSSGSNQMLSGGGGGGANKKTASNNLCLVLSIEKAHLKAFVCPNMSLAPQSQPQPQPSPLNSASKYGEFDVRTTNLNLCVASSEVVKNEITRARSGSKSGRKQSSSSASGSRRTWSTSSGARKKSSSTAATAAAANRANNTKYRIERQYISIYTDQVSIAHASKPYSGGPLKQPTNYATFESLFQTSKTKDLITCNDESVSKVLFGESSDASGGGGNQASSSSAASASSSSANSQVVSVPMVSIGIKSKFNSKTNIKQLLVALNFNSLTLHHLFCAQQDYWIFQLIELFNLIDIEIIGYQVPTVLTELHLNVANSCILYKPLYLSTRSLVAFKSLHWSSNVTAESTHTLLVFNIEDIYLFLSKMANGTTTAAAATNDQQQSQSDTIASTPISIVDMPTTTTTTTTTVMHSAVSNMSSSGGNINLKKEWICVANSDLFELRLLINEEIQKQSTEPSVPGTLKSPLLDIKLRSNMIQLRTCVDSAFTLIELINYIVSDGDLHTPLVSIISTPIATTPSTAATTTTAPVDMASGSTAAGGPASLGGNPTPASLIESNLHLNVIDELSAAIGVGAETIPGAVASSLPRTPSSPLPHEMMMATFSVGTPPGPSSFKSSSSFLNQGAASSSSPGKHLPTVTSGGELVSQHPQHATKSQPIPLPTPSLSYNLKAIAAAASSVGGAGAASSGGSGGGGPNANNNANNSINLSSSAESFISDMMKEAMSSNPMMQSVYGSLADSPTPVTQHGGSGGSYSPSSILKNTIKPSSTSSSHHQMLLVGGRKRNTSLTSQQSPDLQTKRMLSHVEATAPPLAPTQSHPSMLFELGTVNDEDEPSKPSSKLLSNNNNNDDDSDDDDQYDDALVSSNTTDKTLMLLSNNNKSISSTMTATTAALLKESISEEKLGLLTKQQQQAMTSSIYVKNDSDNDDDDDEKENRQELSATGGGLKSSEHDDDENLINLIDSNINMELRSKKQMQDSQSSEPGGIGLSIQTTTSTTAATTTKKDGPSKSATTKTTTTHARRGSVLDDDEFQFEMPFNVELSNLSPLSFQQQQQQQQKNASSASLAASKNPTKSSKTTLKPSTSTASTLGSSGGALSYSALLEAELNSIPVTSSSSNHSNSAQRQLKFGNSPSSSSGAGRRRLYFKPKSDGANRNSNSNSSDEEDDDDADLLKDFDIIDVIPGLGEPPRNNQDFEIKYLKSGGGATSDHHNHHPTNDSNSNSAAAKSSMSYSKYVTSTAINHRIEIRDDHFRKPLTKIDVLKAPDNYPVPLNVYCVQEISINWFLYGGHDFEVETTTTSAHHHHPHSVAFSTAAANSADPNSEDKSSIKMMMNRTASSPVVMSSPHYHPSIMAPSGVTQHVVSSPPRQSSSSNQQRSLTNSPSALSISPAGIISPTNNYYYSPPKSSAHHGTTSNLTAYSPSSSSSVVRFSTKSTSMQFNSKQQSAGGSSGGGSGSQQSMRKAGGRIISSLNWMHRGGRGRVLSACMEISLHKVKTKIDFYTDLSAAALEDENNSSSSLVNKEDSNENNKNKCPYLYRVALAIGDIEIRDKLATSAFNMFLFRYESEQCPKHANSNMIFFKLLCSKSMDSQRLLECDIKLSVQPLRFNIDHDALIFLVEFFGKLASKDLNEFSKNLIAPAQMPVIVASGGDSSTTTTTAGSDQPATMPPPPPQMQQQSPPPQQIFIRNFIFSPDLLIKFDFSGKYDARPDTKTDTFTRLLMMVVQLSNTEIKLKSLCSRRGFLGVEKLFEAIKNEWQADIQRNQMKNILKGWSIFNSLIQFVEGFTYLIWYPIEQYRRDGRVLCGIQKGSAAFSTCTVLATIELTNRMFLATKNVAEFFYDLVTPHRSLQMQAQQAQQAQIYSNNQALMEQMFPGYGSPMHRRMRVRRQPNDIRDGLTNAYYVMYEGINETVANFVNEVAEGAEHKGIPGAIGGALRQLPSAALAPIVLTSEATCNFLTGLRNHINPDEKRDDDHKWKTRDFN